MKVLSERYEMQELLGEGAFGSVYLAQDRRLPRKLAVKIMHRRYASDETARKQFRRELEAGARVVHENVIDVMDVGEDDELGLFYVMEFIEGTALSTRLGDAPLGWPELSLIALQLARALQAVHSHGIVHRDLKPQNLMLIERPGERPLVKLVDFGIAGLVGSAAQRLPQTVPGHEGETHTLSTDATFGTPEYMAPEQTYRKQERDRLNLAVDGRADLYAMGVILYQLASGSLPFEGTPYQLTQAHRHRDPAPLSALPHVSAPVDFCDLVMTLLAKHPADRPESAAEVLGALRAIRGAPTAWPPTPRGRGEPTRRAFIRPRAQPLDLPSDAELNPRPPLPWFLGGAAVLVAAAALAIALLVSGLRHDDGAPTDGAPPATETGSEPGAADHEAFTAGAVGAEAAPTRSEAIPDAR